MDIINGLIFTGKWFTGKVLVQEVLEDSNELKVRLQRDKYATDDDYWWFETWNLQHTKWGFSSGDYFLIKPNTQNKS